MKIRVFPSEKGDCLLVTGDDGKNVLVDGGMRASYVAHVAAALASLRAAGEDLDVVYVSHIDEDHIAGVLQLLEDTMAWRVFDFQTGQGLHPKEPARGRPPKIGQLWHNAFSDVIKDNAGAVAELLAASAGILAASTDPRLLAASVEHRELAQSVRQALDVSRRVGADQLNIPLNKSFGGKLGMVRGKKKIQIGDLEFRLIGPFEADVRKLRDDWDDWLREQKELVRKLRAKAKRDAKSIGNSLEEILDPLAEQAKELGNRKKVTPPNLASLMFHVRDSSRTILLTGDGHSADIVRGLEHHGALEAGKSLHVDLLKVQHHGSEHNIDAPFCQRVTADHYLFCGNGEHENPDLDVVRLIAESRIPETSAAPFKFWFNCASTVPGKAAAVKHMKEVEKLVRRLETDSGGRLSSFFLDGPEFELEF